MKATTTLLVIIILVLGFQSCFINNNSNGPAGCKDPCSNVDYSNIRFENLDNSTIHVRIGKSDNGNELALAGMTIGSILGHTTLSVNFENDKFNHFYFFSDAGFTNSLGKLIVKNTQPLYTSFCNISLKNETDFSPPTGRIRILSLRERLVCFRQKETVDWQVQPFSNASNPLGKCGVSDISSAPADQFLHLYFYSPGNTCRDVNESNLLSQIIVRNNKASKISISSITLRGL